MPYEHLGFDHPGQPTPHPALDIGGSAVFLGDACLCVSRHLEYEHLQLTALRWVPLFCIARDQLGKDARDVNPESFTGRTCLEMKSSVLGDFGTYFSR